MTPETVWPKELTRTIAGQIRHYRDKAGLSAQELADAVSALGLKYTRTQVTNLESGRRDTITVGEVLAFAAVLGRPPALLLFPVGTNAIVPLLPEMSMEAWLAYRAFIGDSVITFNAARVIENHDLVADSYVIGDLGRAENPIPLYREHDAAHYAYLGVRNTFVPGDPDGAKLTERYLSTLAATRITMHDRGWELPWLWAETIRDLAEPLLERGYSQGPGGELQEIADPEGPARMELGGPARPSRHPMPPQRSSAHDDVDERPHRSTRRPTGTHD